MTNFRAYSSILPGVAKAEARTGDLASDVIPGEDRFGSEATGLAESRRPFRHKDGRKGASRIEWQMPSS